MDVLAAYREVGSYRGAAEICGTTHKTVRRIVEAHEASSDGQRRQDSRFCVQAAATGPTDIRNIVIAACHGNNRDIWETTVGLVRYDVSQYDELYADSGALEYSMTVSGRGAPGSGIVVQRDTQLAAQV